MLFLIHVTAGTSEEPLLVLIKLHHAISLVFFRSTFDFK